VRARAPLLVLLSLVPLLSVCCAKLKLKGTFFENMDSPTSTGSGTITKSAIKAVLSAFRTYLSAAGLEPTDQTFHSLCTKLQLLFLISGTLKLPASEASQTHGDMVKGLYEKLHFTEAMVENPKFIINERMMLYLSLAPITEILSVYNRDCFPPGEEVGVFLNYLLKYLCVLHLFLVDL